MAFWIKILLVAGMTVVAAEATYSEVVGDAYCGLFGTPGEREAYLRASALRQLSQEGADPKFMALARKLP